MDIYQLGLTSLPKKELSPFLITFPEPSSQALERLSGDLASTVPCLKGLKGFDRAVHDGVVLDKCNTFSKLL